MSVTATSHQRLPGRGVVPPTCNTCGADLYGATVYRYHAGRNRVALVCAACADEWVASELERAHRWRQWWNDGAYPLDVEWWRKHHHWRKFDTCDTCGAVIYVWAPDYGASWPARYCSPYCRRSARNLRRRSDATRHTCDTCGQSFTGRADARYCSPACRQKAYRQRRETR